ncbi:hypothetical protein LZ30DRAFT_683505 [Colletotrichum cereale]|nr:hypothetical protein LZ30DRAFT_683505 [Colletotrichum cereale]
MIFLSNWSFAKGVPPPRGTIDVHSAQLYLVQEFDGQVITQHDLLMNPWDATDAVVDVHNFEFTLAESSADERVLKLCSLVVQAEPSGNRRKWIDTILQRPAAQVNRITKPTKPKVVRILGANSRERITIADVVEDDESPTRIVDAVMVDDNPEIKAKPKRRTGLTNIVACTGQPPIDIREMAKKIVLDVPLIDMMQLSPEFAKALRAMSQRIVVRKPKKDKDCKLVQHPLSGIGFAGLTMSASGGTTHKMTHFVAVDVITHGIKREIWACVRPGDSDRGVLLLLGMPWLFDVKAMIDPWGAKMLIGDTAIGEEVVQIDGPLMDILEDQRLVLSPATDDTDLLGRDRIVGTMESPPESEVDSDSDASDSDDSDVEELTKN